MDDVSANSDDEKITHILTHLTPYTRYAYYVKTYTIANEVNGAESKMDYFLTLPAGEYVFQKHPQSQRGDHC